VVLQTTVQHMYTKALKEDSGQYLYV